MNRFQFGVLVVLTALCVGAGANAATGVATGAGPPVLDEAEVARIIENGPWPPTFRPDPTNRVSGMPEAIAFGRRMGCA